MEHLCQNWQYFGMHRAGGYAELVTVPERCCIRLPDGVDAAEAACLPVAGLTAFHALVSVGKLEPGETPLRERRCFSGAQVAALATLPSS